MGGDAIIDNIVPDDNIFALSKYALIFEQILDYLEGIPGVEVQGKSADRGWVDWALNFFLLLYVSDCVSL